MWNCRFLVIKRMKTLKKLPLQLSFLCACVAASASEDIRPASYFFGQIGASILPGIQFNSSPDLFVGGTKSNDEVDMRLEFTSGAALEVAMGYQFGSLRSEAEVGYLSIDSDQMAIKNHNDAAAQFRLSASNDKGVGVFSGIYGVVSALYELPVSDAYFTPYFGVGAGLFHYNFDTANTNYGAEKSPGRESSPVFQGVLGVRYQSKSSGPSSWAFRYRYRQLRNVKIDLIDQTNGGVQREFKVDESIYTTDFGITYAYRLDSLR